MAALAAANLPLAVGVRPNEKRFSPTTDKSGRWTATPPSTA
ncbi:hypothetical protein ACFQJD_03215 [Haloplanus sp. GCM10025708]